MVVYYIYDWAEYPDRKEWQVFTGGYSGRFNFYHPSESRWFIPGSYQQMMEDHG